MLRDPRTFIPKTKGPCLGIYTVSEPVAPLHHKRSRQSGLETQLLFGQQFAVFEKDKSWAWGQSRSPLKGSKQKGYVGFVPLKYLEDTNTQADYVVTALKAPLFSKADIKSPIRKFLPLGALLNNDTLFKNRANGGKFLRLISGEFIHVNHVRKRSEEPALSDFVDIAQQHTGLPYVWGGLSSEGLDCSGLVLSSLRATGQDGPRDADMQQAELGESQPLKQSNLKRGDLIFWKGHVAIMISALEMIHANAFHMSVETEPLKDAAQRIFESGGGSITAIKRL